MYFPPATQVPSSTRRTSTIARPTIHIVLPTVSIVPVALPPVDLTGVLTPPVDLPVVVAGGGDPHTGSPNASDSAGAVLSADQVEKQVVVAPGNAAPRYPEALRNAGVEGQLTAMFVVNELGRAEDSTVRFAHAGNTLFEEAVRAALHRMRFVAAEVGGRKVRQLVQMPFVFTISK